MPVGLSMCLRSAFEMMPLDPALKALALRATGYRDGFTGSENAGIKNLSDLIPGGVGYPEFLQDAMRACSGLLQNAKMRTGQAPFRSRAEAEFQCVVSVRPIVLDLYDRAGPRFHHGNGDEVVALVVYLGHPDFFSDQSQHGTMP